MENERVLVIDDEPDLRRLIVHGLRHAGFDAEAEGEGRAGIARAQAMHPSVVVLDLMLPDMLGTAVCSAFRAQASLSDIGVVMLTARGSERDRIDGFESGADDYLVKPFSVRELVLRVGALAKRRRDARAPRSSNDTAHVCRVGEIAIDLVLQRATVDGQEVPLRPLEFRLLATLMVNAGRTLSRGELLANVWGRGEGCDSRTVDTHVLRLRDKLGATGDRIETLVGIGYRLRATGLYPRGDHGGALDERDDASAIQPQAIPTPRARDSG